MPTTEQGVQKALRRLASLAVEVSVLAALSVPCAMIHSMWPVYFVLAYGATICGRMFYNVTRVSVALDETSRENSSQ